MTETELDGTLEIIADVMGMARARAILAV